MLTVSFIVNELLCLN